MSVLVAILLGTSYWTNKVAVPHPADLSISLSIIAIVSKGQHVLRNLLANGVKT